MRKRVRKAVFPIAGICPRFLPATKVMPKEMLPIVDKPLIQYAVEEAKAAGIEEFFFVTGRTGSIINDHFDRSLELEVFLRERGRTDLLAELETWLPDVGRVVYTRQQTPLGLGHAVWCAHSLVGNEPFAVLLADDLMVCEVPCLRQMLDAYEQTGGNVVAVVEDPRERTPRYGVLDILADDGRLARAGGVVEKPDPTDAPSMLSVIGRYIIQPEVFAHLAKGEQDSGMEIQLTDGLARLISDGQSLHGLRIDGRRFDCSDKLGFLQATIAFGLKDPELGPSLRQMIQAHLC
jgi:UTP--glucose-1-phosphate uridylyltransferase